MNEYRVFASIYDDLHTPAVVRRPFAKEPGHSTSIHTIKCNSLEEIPDKFLDVCGDECYGMKKRIYWYVDDGNRWVLADL